MLGFCHHWSLMLYLLLFQPSYNIYIYIYIYINIYIYILWRVGCLPPLIVSINASSRLPTGVGVWERRGAETARSGGVWWGTHLKWMEPHHHRCYMPSAPLLWRPVSSPCMHAGVLVGPGRERRAWRTAPARRLTGQDAGPGCRAVPLEAPRAQRRMKPPIEAAALAPRTQGGARAATGLRPLPGPFLPEHCPSFTTRAARRGHQIPCLFWTLNPLWTLYFFISV